MIVQWRLTNESLLITAYGTENAKQSFSRTRTGNGRRFSLAQPPEMSILKCYAAARLLEQVSMTTADTATRALISTNSDAPTSLAPEARRALAPEERQRLLLENLSEVQYVARRIHIRLPRHVPFADLVQEGVVGLIDAVEKFDPAKNVQLRSYARFRIRGAILDSLRELDWGPRQLRRQARHIEQTRNELTLRLGRAPSEPEVAVQLGVPLAELRQILTQIHCLRIETAQALPRLTSKQGLASLHPNGAQEDPFDACVKAETARTLGQAMETLGEKERQALTLYYFEERTMKDIGRVLNVQESRISQIIAAALGRLRALMQKNEDVHARTEPPKRRWRGRQRLASRQTYNRRTPGSFHVSVRERWVKKSP